MSEIAVARVARIAREHSKSALEYEVCEIPLYNHILNRTHCFREKVRVGCVGVMNVDLFVWRPHQTLELVCKEYFC